MHFRTTPTKDSECAGINFTDKSILALTMDGLDSIFTELDLSVFTFRFSAIQVAYKGCLSLVKQHKALRDYFSRCGAIAHNSQAILAVHEQFFELHLCSSFEN
jgi:hypothetical protein